MNKKENFMHVKKSILQLCVGLAVLFGNSSSKAQQEQLPIKENKDRSAGIAASPCDAAFGFETFRLGGVFGHHAETMMRGNLLKLDMENDFIGPFCHRTIKDPPGAAVNIFYGIGSSLDAG